MEWVQSQRFPPTFEKVIGLGLPDSDNMFPCVAPSPIEQTKLAKKKKQLKQKLKLSLKISNYLISKCKYLNQSRLVTNQSKGQGKAL